jgi:hypothetical protein
MKYTIHINQFVLSNTKLDITDAGVLDYIAFACGSTNTKIEKERITVNNTRWTWVDLKTMAKDMPLLKIKSTGALTRRIQKIVTTGYIATYRKDGRRLFARLEPKFDELLIQINGTQAPTVDTNQRNHSPASTYKDNKNKEDFDKEATAQPGFPNGEHKKTSPVGSTANRLAEAQWLQDMPDTELAYFKENYPQLTEEQIRSQARGAYLWLEDNPSKNRSGKKLFLKNWLDRYVGSQQKKGERKFHEWG